MALAEDLGDRAVLVTQDQIAGNELARTGDLAPANVRLQQRGVRIERRSLLRAVRPGEVELEDRFTGPRRIVAAAAVVDCGYRLPDDPRPDAAAPRRRLRRPPYHPRGHPRGPPRRAWRSTDVRVG